MKKILLTVLLICAALILSSPVRTQPKTVSGGDNLVSIKLKGVDGKQHDIANLRGNILVVSFGATWCIPCHEELRDLETLQREFERLPVRFIWVSIDTQEDSTDEELRRFAKSLKLTLPILRDPDKRAYKQFSERTRVPLVVFLDKEGQVIAPKHFGASSQPGLFRMTIRNRLRKLLENEPAANWRQENGD